MNPEQLNQLMRSRRSVFPAQFNGKTIPKETIQQLLENANWAPTHKLTEPWRFKIFTAKGLDAFIDFLKLNYQKNTPPEKFRKDKMHKFETFKSSVSHAVVICMKRHEKTLSEMEEIAAVAMAVQNIYLSTTAFGIGGYWSTGGCVFSAQMRSFLRLNEDEQCLGVFYLGCYDKILQKGKREPISEKIEWFE